MPQELGQPDAESVMPSRSAPVAAIKGSEPPQQRLAVGQALDAVAGVAGLNVFDTGSERLHTGGGDLCGYLRRVFGGNACDLRGAADAEMHKAQPEPLRDTGQTAQLA